MAATPQFASTPRASSVAVSTANANRDGTGTVGTVIIAGSSGTRISRVVIKALGTTTAGMVRLFLHDGTNYILLCEVLVSAITASATVAAFESLMNELDNGNVLPLTIPSGWSLRASTEKAESFRVTALGADL